MAALKFNTFYRMDAFDASLPYCLISGSVFSTLRPSMMRIR